MPHRKFEKRQFSAEIVYDQDSHCDLNDLFNFSGNKRPLSVLNGASRQAQCKWVASYAAISQKFKSHVKLPSPGATLHQKPAEATMAIEYDIDNNDGPKEGSEGSEEDLSLDESSKSSDMTDSNDSQHSFDSQRSEFSGVWKVPVIANNGNHSNYDLPGRSYVYNPVPIRKKSKKNAVPVAAKDNRYWTLRVKNNIAARKSREDRRKKEIEVVKKCDSLVSENEMLRRENTYLKAAISTLEGIMHGKPGKTN